MDMTNFVVIGGQPISEETRMKFLETHNSAYNRLCVVDNAIINSLECDINCGHIIFPLLKSECIGLDNQTTYVSYKREITPQTKFYKIME